MAIFYRVVNGEKFEKSRSREVQKMSWVAVPNKLDGDGFSTLLDHPNGAAHYGAWMVILLVASKCEPRWVLTRDGKRAHDSISLSRISGIPKEIFDELLPRLTENEVGWLETVDENWQPVMDGRQQVVPTCRPDGNESCLITLQNKTEQDRTEQNITGQDKTEQTPKPPRGDFADEVREVFDHYRTYHAKSHPKPSSTSKEWRAIIGRLSEGYSVQDLREAIDGCHKTPWNCGENPGGKIYQSLLLIVRDSSQVSRFMEFARAGPAPVLSEKTQRTGRAAQQYLEMKGFRS